MTEEHVRVEEFRRKHRTGLVTLVFTDIVGSTALKQALGDREALARIQQHHALVRELLRAFTQGTRRQTRQSAVPESAHD
jgi:class 3 adenylate cyclase